MIEPGIRVGTVGYPVRNRKKVFDHVDVIELAEGRRVPPGGKVARRWRADVPARIGLTVQLSDHLFEAPAEGVLAGDRAGYGGFRPTEENTALWRRELELAEALGALAVVLITPSAFTPAPVHRDALAAFLAAQPRPPCEMVWEPHGPWERDLAASFALENGMVLAVDPIRDEPAPGSFAYFRLGPFSAMGSRLGVYDLERIADAAGPFERVICVMDTVRALDDAKNLRKILAGVDPEEDD
jgi:uncharacterized protein YecE (DUF72 family)